MKDFVIVVVKTPGFLDSFRLSVSICENPCHVLRGAALFEYFAWFVVKKSCPSCIVPPTLAAISVPNDSYVRKAPDF